MCEIVCQVVLGSMYCVRVSLPPSGMSSTCCVACHLDKLPNQLAQSGSTLVVASLLVVIMAGCEKTPIAMHACQ